MEGNSFQQRDLKAIDLMKFIAAIMVVYGHTEPLKSISPEIHFIIFNGLSRLAVPFFFMTSGYLFYGKLILEHSKSKIPFLSDCGFKSLQRLFTLYCVWSLVYFPFMVYQVLGRHTSAINLIVYCLRSVLYLGTSFHLWYFPALFLAILILDAWKSRFQLKSLLIVASFLYLIGALGETYFGLIPTGSVLFDAFQQYFSVFVTTRNGVFLGLIFVVIGAYLREKPIRMTANRSARLTIVFMLLLIVEAVFVFNFTKPRDYNFLISIVPASFFLFHTLINTKLSWKINFKTLRKLSTLIYCSHIGFFILLPVIFQYLGIGEVYKNGIIRFTLVYFLSLAFSMWIIKLAEYQKIGFVFKKMF